MKKGKNGKRKDRSYHVRRRIQRFKNSRYFVSPLVSFFPFFLSQSNISTLYTRVLYKCRTFARESFPPNTNKETKGNVQQERKREKKKERMWTKRRKKERKKNEKRRCVCVYTYTHIYIYISIDSSHFVFRSHNFHTRSLSTSVRICFNFSSLVYMYIRVLWFLNAVQEHLYLLNRLDRTFHIFFLFSLFCIQ